MDTLKMDKKKHEVVIFTREFKIEGDIHILEGERITDFLCALDKKQFIPITNAAIFKVDSLSHLYKTQYLSLNKDEIVLLMPKDQIKKKDYLSE